MFFFGVFQTLHLQFQFSIAVRIDYVMIEILRLSAIIVLIRIFVDVVGVHSIFVGVNQRNKFVFALNNNAFSNIRQVVAGFKFSG